MKVLEQRQLGRRAPDHGQVTASQRQYLRHQQPQSAIAQHIDPTVRRDGNLFTNLERRRQRFDKDRLLIGQPIRHDMKISDRQRQIIGKGAIPVNNAQALPVATMFTQPTATEIAVAAANVEFANHTSANPHVVAWRGHHFPNKFVAQDTSVAPFIASHQL